MSKKILVVGCKGQLGTALKNCQVNVLARDLPDIDITSYPNVISNFDSYGLSEEDVVINCAAYTNVAKAESEDLELARRVNVDGVKNLADACVHFGCSLIHISTNFVYKGTEFSTKIGHKPFRDDLYMTPCNEYGWSKLHGEEEGLKIFQRENVENIFGRFLIVRTSGLYSARSGNFVTKLIDKVLDSRNGNTSIPLYVDQYMDFTNANELAKQLIYLANLSNEERHELTKATNGVLHCVNKSDGSAVDSGSVYGFAKEILKAFDLEDRLDKLNPVKYPEDFICPDGVKRPKYALLEPTLTGEHNQMVSSERAIKRLALEYYNRIVKCNPFDSFK